MVVQAWGLIEALRCLFKMLDVGEYGLISMELACNSAGDVSTVMVGLATSGSNSLIFITR